MGKKHKSNQKHKDSTNKELRGLNEGNEEFVGTLVCSESINNVDDCMEYLTDNCNKLDLEPAKQQIQILSSHVSRLKQQVSNGKLPQSNRYPMFLDSRGSNLMM